MKAWLTAEDDGVRIHFQKDKRSPVASFLMNPEELTDFAIALAEKVAELRTGKGMWKLSKAVLDHVFKKE